MSGGAVQRRRGGGSSENSSASSRNPASANRLRVGGSRDEGEDHKIAYDPQDAAQTESSTAPALTLMEEVLLVGLKDDQGYLSFWNDSISYVLRGCIMIELALQGKIAVVNDPARRQYPLSDRLIEVKDSSLTGEVLLDESLKIMQESEPMTVSAWIDALSGETWNFSKIGYQLKQVRERLAKGLVDKGICRTEKKSFLLFDMATHPVVDFSAKQEIRKRLLDLLTSSTYTPEYTDSKWFPKRLPMRTLRTVALAASTYAANVLENLLPESYDARDAAFLKVDELLTDYSEFPFLTRNSAPWISSVSRAVNAEIPESGSMTTRLEVVAAVIRVYTQLDAVV